MGTLVKTYEASYSSYSGCDIVATITISDFSSKPLVLGELQTVSYSIHREVSPVRTLGRINPKGFTNGTRTIAGSLIFTVFDKNLVHKVAKLIREGYKSNPDNGSSTSVNPGGPIKRDYSARIQDVEKYSVMDEMPPFDISISFMNEYGNRSVLVIKGVVIVDEGQVMSVEDMITENTMSYMATDIQVMNNIEEPSLVRPAVDFGKSDTALRSISTSVGSIFPEFDPSNTIYGVNLPKNTTTVPSVTCVPRDPSATVSVENAKSLPGITKVMVIGTDGSLTRYKIYMSAVGSDATLKGITVGGVSIPSFDPSDYEYTIELPSDLMSIPKVEGTKNDISARIEAKRPYSLPGSYTLTVTAEDGITSNVYRVNLVYAYASNEAALSLISTSAGTMSPAFSEGVFNYTITMPAATISPPTVAARAKSSAASVYITQATSIPGTATIAVTAQDGVTQKLYTCNITK